MSINEASLTSGPVGTRERALAPDLARGLMLALIAVANAVVYLHGREYGIRQHIIENGLLNRIVSVLTVTLVDGRAYPMFAALFAYGVVQIFQRQRAAGVPEPQVRQLLRRRSRWLILFGFAHAVLLFPGDILGLYGLVGFILVSLIRVPDRRLLVAAAWWLVAVALVQGAAYMSPATGERSFFWSFESADPLRALILHPFEWLMTPLGVLGVGSAVLVGTWAARRGILTDPAAHRPLLIRTATVGLTTAIVGGLPAGLAVGHFWEPTATPELWGISALHAVTGIAGGLGYAALIGLFAIRAGDRPGPTVRTGDRPGPTVRTGDRPGPTVRTGDRPGPTVRTGDRPGPVVRALAATGQRSLSCYLFQSVVFVALLMPYTLGLGATLGTAAVTAIALATWLVSVLLADLSRRAGRRGPAEVLLRRLTYRTGKIAG